MSDYHSRRRKEIVRNIDQNVISLHIGKHLHSLHREQLFTNRINQTKSIKKQQQYYLLRSQIRYNWPEYTNDRAISDIEKSLLDLEISLMV